MCRLDVRQVIEIDREAFPTMWPPPNYQRELDNRLAYYIVACDDSIEVEEPEAKETPYRGLWGLASRVKHLFDHDRFFGEETPSSGKEYVAGFAGIWNVAQEAHITNIAVRESYRQQGVGEHLLISIIDIATELNSQFLTLEVRLSNTTAQNLYRKYGFNQVGLRRGYYTDNREDAVLMSTENIIKPPFQAQLQQLKQAHSRRWGVPLYEIIS